MSNEEIATESPVEDQTPTDAPEPQDQGDPETFDRAYVEKLRDESAKYRQRAGKADELAAALWSANVAATGRLADPSDLTMPDDVDVLDAESVGTAVDDLLARKPHLASRRPSGDIGQGATNVPPGGFDLAGVLRRSA